MRNLVILSCFLWLGAAAHAVEADPGSKARVSERRLLAIDPGKVESPIQVKSGEVLQILPFTYPVTREFIGAKLQVKVTGDRFLEPLGQTSLAGEGEGRSGSAVFFLVRGKGRAEANLVLTDESGQPIDDFAATYAVHSK